MEQQSLMPRERLSQAYPPSSTQNFNYIAQVHEKLQNFDIDSFKLEDIKYRPAKTTRDIAQLKKLQQEWFPIEYSNNFYEAIVNNQVQSLIAEIELKYQTGRKENYIIGAIVYRTKSSKRRYYGQQWKEWFCSFFQQHQAIYILTLGVINEFRGKKIADYLLNEVKKIVYQNTITYKYIYLHMVAYNISAAKFYQKHGFTRVKVKQNHYEIENNRYDAYIYLWRIN